MTGHSYLNAMEQPGHTSTTRRLHSACCASNAIYILVLLLGLLQHSIGANTFNSIIDDQIQSLRLAQSYTNVTGLLNEVLATASTNANQVLSESTSPHPC